MYWYIEHPGDNGERTSALYGSEHRRVHRNAGTALEARARSNVGGMAVWGTTRLPQWAEEPAPCPCCGYYDYKNCTEIAVLSMDREAHGPGAENDRLGRETDWDRTIVCDGCCQGLQAEAERLDEEYSSVENVRLREAADEAVDELHAESAEAALQFHECAGYDPEDSYNDSDDLDDFETAQQIFEQGDPDNWDDY